MYGISVGTLPTLGYGRLPPSSLAGTPFSSSREPVSSAPSKETPSRGRGPATDPGYPSVDEIRIPGFDTSSRDSLESCKGHHA